MNKFQREITKAKKTFNIKENNLILNYRIVNLVNELRKKQSTTSSKMIYTKCYDLFYILEGLKRNYNHLTPFALYKIFKLCLYGLNELVFFNDTIGNSKSYKYSKINDIIERAKPFILNTEEIKTRIPFDPNDTYNNIYFKLLDDYSIKKDDIINLLSIVYERDKKAKIPKRTLKEVQFFKEWCHRIIKTGGKQKGLSDKEIKDKIDELNDKKCFKKYQ